MVGRKVCWVCSAVASSLLFVCHAIGQGTLSSNPRQATLPSDAGQVINRTQSPFEGSVSQVPNTGAVMELTLEEAVSRGIRYNLGLYLSKQTEQHARGARVESLAGILPTVNGSIDEQVQKVNLQALGIGGVHIDGITIPNSVGPFSTNDVTAAMTWTIFNLQSINTVRAASENVRASNLNYRDARETVVIAICANYLLTIAAESRAASDRAQLETSESLFELAQDQEKSGVGTYIDSLRANVEVKSRQQQLTEAEDRLAKQQIALARAIGLAVKQRFRITDQIPYKPLSVSDRHTAFETALKNRPDYLNALSQSRSAELLRNAAWGQYLPSLRLHGDYGVIGRNPLSVSPQWTAAGSIQIPIFQGGKIEGEVKQADAILSEKRAMVANLRNQIEQEVENAVLDLQAANQQVETATAQLQLANETLAQARDRFSAGVTNNIEVIQAQESVAAANDSYISSLYSYNVAKVLLARSVGDADKSVLQYLQVPANTAPAPNLQP